MEIVESRYFARWSLITNIVESCKTCTLHVDQAVVRYQEMFLPSHIHKILFQWIVHKSILVKFVGVRFEGGKSFLATLKSQQIIVHPKQTNPICIPSESHRSVGVLATFESKTNILVLLFRLERTSTIWSIVNTLCVTLFEILLIVPWVLDTDPLNLWYWDSLSTFLLEDQRAR